MTTINPKILAAISGAIGSYLADEEAACAGCGQAAATAAPGPPLCLWALAGRSEAMQMRQLMQRRV